MSSNRARKMPRHNSLKGFAALLFTLIVLISSSMLTYIASQRVSAQHISNLTFLQKTIAFQVAQAGLDYSIPFASENYTMLTDGFATSLNVQAHSCNVVFQFLGDKDTILVTSTGATSDGSAIQVLSHIIRYAENNNTITSSYPLQSAGPLVMNQNAVISNMTPGATYTTRLGEGVSIMNKAGTYLESGVSSNSSQIGSDIITYSNDLLGLGDGDMEMMFLGAPISDYQTASPDMYIPTQYSDFSYSESLEGLEGVTVSLSQSGGTGSINNNTQIGAEDNPVMIEINLSNSADFSVAEYSNVYGKLIVNNGSLQVLNNAIIHGDLVVNGDLLLGNNVEILGDVIVTGNVNMDQSSIVKGAVFALGDVDMDNYSEIQGAVFSGGSNGISMSNRSKVIYDPDNAAINVPGSVSSDAAYGLVSGSWNSLASAD